MYERYLDALWYVVPLLSLQQIVTWYLRRALRKGRITQAWFDEIRTYVLTGLVVIAVVGFVVYCLM